MVARWIQSLYGVAIRPKSLEDDAARQELILSCLTLGMVLLSFIAFCISFGRYVGHTKTEYQASPVTMAIIFTILLLFYGVVRYRYSKILLYIYLILNYIIATYALYEYGYLLIQGLLLYALIVVISGLVISQRAILLTTMVLLSSLVVLHVIQSGTGVGQQLGYKEPENIGDLVISLAIFFEIVLVTWLYSREIQISLKDLRHSQEMLQHEQENLEKKVLERTRDLEQAQAEQTIELYRFAEFGKLSSSLLHDLANPLTSVSMNLDELSHRYDKNELLDQIHEGISSMESYVRSARDQLNNRRSLKTFYIDREVKRVTELYRPRLRSANVVCSSSLQSKGKLKGDSVKFDQLIGNILGNAIDAIAELSPRDNRPRRIDVVSRRLKDQNAVEIKISDTGIGIAPDRMDEIFKPFFFHKKENSWYRYWLDDCESSRPRI